MAAIGERLVRSSVARSTGTRVDVIDRRDDGEGWETICVEHGGVCSHETRKLALSFAAAPEEWCEDCQYGPGTLDGTRDIDVVETQPVTAEQALDLVAVTAAAADKSRAEFEAAIVAASSYASYAAIAERAGLSRSRIHQIIAEKKAEA